MKFNDFSMILKQIWILMIFQELWEPCLCEGTPPVISRFPSQRPVMYKAFPYDDTIKLAKQKQPARLTIPPKASDGLFGLNIHEVGWDSTTSTL